MSDKVFCFKGEINTESVSELIIGINEHLMLSKKNSATLYFSSVGGEAQAGDTLIHYLNSVCELVFLRVNGDIYSQGLITYLEFRGIKSIISDLVEVMAHYSYADLRYNGTKIKNDKSYKAQLDIRNAGLIKLLLENKFPSKIVDKVKEGKDVYLMNHEYKDFLK